MRFAHNSSDKYIDEHIPLIWWWMSTCRIWRWQYRRLMVKTKWSVKILPCRRRQRQRWACDCVQVHEREIIEGGTSILITWLHDKRSTISLSKYLFSSGQDVENLIILSAVRFPFEQTFIYFRWCKWTRQIATGYMDLEPIFYYSSLG